MDDFTIPEYQELIAWNVSHNFYPMIDPTTDPNVDYHRLQLEYWLWRSQEWFPRGTIVDVGAEYRRKFDYTDSNVVTVNVAKYDTPYGPCDPDIIADVCEHLPFADGSVSVVVCTETLEHVESPMQALLHIDRLLDTGGQLLLTVPFLWPEHGDENFPDYWRWTEDGLRLLMQRVVPRLEIVEFRATVPRRASFVSLRVMRGYEKIDLDRRWPTGFLIKAVKRS